MSEIPKRRVEVVAPVNDSNYWDFVSLYEHEYDHDWHWRYVPDKDLMHHREFYIGNFAKDSRADGIYLETGIRRFDEKSARFEGEKPIIDAITINENGVYQASNGIHGYSPITVDIPAYVPVVEEITITENGTY